MLPARSTRLPCLGKPLALDRSVASSFAACATCSLVPRRPTKACSGRNLAALGFAAEAVIRWADPRRAAPSRIAIDCLGLTAFTNLVRFWCAPVSASSRNVRRQNCSLPSGSARSYRCGRRSLRS